ncbi:L-type lectin-domain containing receptor kinase -like [Olea europaea subsp. europaea]|uniref:non-specific serine/threonine protein kinase n=1 Tax=Olea europaea subsp. europaea TaxID=158383 RepID=A0A8S0PPE4_OLEEU|nr:L-type lectin-domain containing receptor kinase -like [Olea europaea subsp. europaea]
MVDFYTHFRFVIDSNNSNCHADGLTFFLAPVDLTIPRNSSGSGLGLAYFDAMANISGDPFVAVEFDTYTNDWDPYGPHVGIDINSLISVTNFTWRNNITEGRQNDAWIGYNSTTKNLSVIFTGYMSNQKQKSRLDYKSWEFNSSLEIVNNSSGPADPPTVTNINPNPSSAVNNGGKKMKMGLVIGLIVGLSVLILGSVLIGYSFWRKRNREGEKDDVLFDTTMDIKFETGCGPKKFSYGELVRAKDNFAVEKKLGEGGFGGVYQGVLRDLNSYIAVKRVSKDSKQGHQEYASEVKIISKLRHKNFVQPVGTKLPQGLASALLYLHDGCEQCVIHRDIKSSNIILDSNFNAKLRDFGLARLVDHEKGSQTTVLAGTMGYMAPECATTGKASKESDVYSFGIVALEIPCGRRPIDAKAQANRVRMAEWVWDLYGTGKLLEAADPKLCADYDEQEIERLMVIGLWYAHPDNNLRPSMKEAIHVFNFKAQLTLLASKLPVPTYYAPPFDMLKLLASQSSGVNSFLASNTSISDAFPSVSRCTQDKNLS